MNDEMFSSLMRIKEEVDIHSLKDTGVVYPDGSSLFTANYSFRGKNLVAKICGKNLSLNQAKIHVACLYV